LYLLTSDFEPDLYASTAFGLDELATMVGGSRGNKQYRRVRNILVIMDTCYAGKATQELTARFAKILGKTSDRSFYLLGAALPLQEAEAGALATAMIDSIADLSKRHVMQEWLFLEQIVPAINKRLRIHDAILSAVISPHEDPQFFPNPSFVDTAGRPVLANEAQRSISDQEFREHWGPRSRGVEFDNQAGSYFFGRGVALGMLSTFLQSEADHRTRIVTGRPGSGKSAILSRLVRGQGLAPDVERPNLALALHAKGKTLADVRTRLATVLDVKAETDGILNHLRDSRKARYIVIDALDEAVEPQLIAENLLAPMNAIPSVKLVVGTRETQLKSLPEAEVIDIDKPEHIATDDIAQYVTARLLRSDEKGVPTPYSGQEKIAARVAQRVAEKAYPNFLVARLAVEDLLGRPGVAKPDSPADMAFPTKVSGAFDAYLARFGAKETAVRDILLPLAYAEGQGLPWDNIWAPLASALSARPYTDEDIQWVLENAGAFVLESIEEKRSVYRLYHQALADVMRRGRRARNVQTVFTRTLIASARQRPGKDRPDWLLASRYVRSHLATHAARCGRLKDLMRVPLYLVAADPEPLLREIAAHETTIPPKLRSAYRGAVHHIREESPEIAASYLELIARQRDLPDLADDIAASSLQRPWNVPWAQWTLRAPSGSLARGTSPILTLVGIRAAEVIAGSALHGIGLAANLRRPRLPAQGAGRAGRGRGSASSR
jgi:hypothetical protein